MVADRRLWIDQDGKLCEAPPSVGMVLAKKGADIFPRHVNEFHLDVVDGVVVQNGKAALSPESTPPALIADRTLFIEQGTHKLVSKKPTEGIKIADKGEKIPRTYVNEYNLSEVDGEIVQKSIPKAPNKAINSAPNKGRGGKSRT